MITVTMAAAAGLRAGCVVVSQIYMHSLNLCFARPVVWRSFAGG